MVGACFLRERNAQVSFTMTQTCCSGAEPRQYAQIKESKITFSLSENQAFKSSVLLESI